MAECLNPNSGQLIVGELLVPWRQIPTLVTSGVDPLDENCAPEVCHLGTRRV